MQKTNCITCQTYTAFESISHLKEKWDDFIQANSGDFFMTFDWLRIWWKHYKYKRNLKIYLFWADRVLVGILPVYLDKIRIGPISVNAIKLVSEEGK